MPPIAITVIAVAVIIVINILVAFEFGEIAVMKGFPEKKTKIILMCIFLSVAGYFLACALPDRNKDGEKRLENNMTGNDELSEL